MSPRRLVPPPEQATWMDAYRFGLGFLMLALGIVIFARALSANTLSAPAILMSVAFVGFGIYRIYVGIVRYRMYRASPHKSEKR
jgi:thiol:disulfide interchange protein